MATTFTEVDGRWCFMARVRLRTGFAYKRPYRLWKSREDAEKDVELFVWYSSIRGAGDPRIPNPKKKKKKKFSLRKS